MNFHVLFLAPAISLAALSLAMAQEGEGPAVTRGPYLQKGTATGVAVRWRTDIETSGRVRYGIHPANLDRFADGAGATAEHEVTLAGLDPATRYFYSIGTDAETLAAGPDLAFFTAPVIGSAQATRVWVLGDSGTANVVAQGVRDGYRAFAGDGRTDVWLMLGDNAYGSGTDAEFQRAVFETYPGFLRQTVLWSAVGNHDTAFSPDPDVNTTPYFRIFSFPTQGEAGGMPSGTEKYYSFDYGRIHFISLDSMSSSRAPGSPMLTWLQADLESTMQDWIVAFWHHPPYTKGSHNSDAEGELIEMRENVLPLLEAGGVDLVLTGHSHCYERSFLIDGHYGFSPSFDETMLLDGGDGREDGTGAYMKPAALAGNQGAVYAVAGNGGQVSFWSSSGTVDEFNPLPHPVMYYSALHAGSMVIDIVGNRLDAKMVLATGAIDDRFTILKEIPNAPPAVSVVKPSEGETFRAPASITLSAEAADADGTVVQVDFYAGDEVIGTAKAAPFSLVWRFVAAGEYTLTAAATDDRGATTVSAPVHITVGFPLPAAPTDLKIKTQGKTKVRLTWTDNATNETGYVVESSTNGWAFSQLGVLGANTTRVRIRGLESGTAHYFRVHAIGAGGVSADSEIVSTRPRKSRPRPTQR